MSGYLLSGEFVAIIRRVVRDYAADIRNTVGGRTRSVIGQRNRQAYLLQDLYAAEDTLADPSTARARLLRKNAAGNLELTNVEVTVVTRVFRPRRTPLASIRGACNVRRMWLQLLG
jgi:hypothetical protein